MKVPTIETDRLILRAIRMEDWPPYAAMWADARVTEFIGGAPRPREVAWAKFGQGAGFWPLLGYGYWSIVDRRDSYLGVGGFARHERGLAELGDAPECGWTFAPHCWGRGIATEAVAAMVAWADDALGVETRCLISHGNAASVRVAERNGFVLSDEISDAAVFRRPARAGADRAPS
jgi:RimJ/RimL family protein N-acetyltransferase